MKIHLHMHLDLVESELNESKMIMKMLTHMHMVMYTWCCYHILRRRWSLSGREGFGVLSPSHRALLGRIQHFSRNETPIFHYAEREEMEANGGH
jgi:hypothetical protein